MAMSLNRAQLIGNLTRDPELKQIPGGNTVASFSIATNFTWSDASGQKQEKVEFHNIVAWRKLAEIVGQYVKKGSKVFVEGRIQTRDWEGEDGVKRYRTEIVADNIIMLDRKGAAVEGGEIGMSSNSNYGSNAGAGNFAGMTRGAAGLKRKQPQEMSAADAGETVEAPSEEVAIEDLPF